MCTLISVVKCILLLIIFVQISDLYLKQFKQGKILI